MLIYYYYFIQYRLDIILAALLALAGCFATGVYLQRRTKGAQTLAPRAWFLAGILILLGGMVAEWMGREQADKLVQLFAGFGPTYAAELRRHRHEQINLSTPPNDPHYLELIEMQKLWLKANPLISDIYTYRRGW